MTREFTYSSEVLLVIVLLSSVHIIIDSDEARAASTTELGSNTEHGDSVLSGLELLADDSSDFGLLDTSQIRVDHLNGLETEIRVSVGKRARSKENVRIAFCREGGSRRPFECKE